jgi:hypothetical protein
MGLLMKLMNDATTACRRVYGGKTMKTRYKRGKKLKTTWFDKNDQPVIIDGIAQRDLHKNEQLYYYGELL